MAKRWSPEELAIAERIKNSDMTVKESAYLLPGRSLLAIKCHVSKVEGGMKKRGKTSWVWPAIVRELTDEPNQTIGELAKRIGCCNRQVYDYFLECHGSKLFVSGWNRSGSHYRERLSLGSEPDVAKPPKQTREERRRLDRMRYLERASKTKPFNVMLMQLGVAKQVSLSVGTGRVYQQSMSIKDDELEAA